MMETDLRTLLEAACPFPVVWGFFNEGSLPRASIFLVGALPDMTMRGVGATNYRVQIDVFAASTDEVIAAARIVRSALSGHRGGDFLGVFLEGAQDMSTDDSEILPRVKLDFSIWHRD